MDSDRDFWREQDARYDREVAYSDRVEADEHGRRSLAQGNTFEAIRSVAGPDAALYYLEGMSAGDDEQWPPHHYPLDAESLAENINEMPRQARPRVRVDEDDVRVDAMDRFGEGEVIGSFTAQRSTVAEYLTRRDEFAGGDHVRAAILALRQALFM